ncbi:MAG: class I SAM-dependent methyltransferase [Methanosarcina sp.]|uniref:class I SAM-dependent methyltransferase n=1 Tax=Methanosarcina sp. TaxID=2213 RepID=UPI0026348C64|nr:class I SAM-dependent methyltransferase [Methanosarcina sp.]MDD3245282.1 class I SAM-dependent methyltransferase [Methanosarcina sp.]MDD4248041.1 class I SAM-dependent methyltransferase [Methanosarcina sp.]
MSEGLGNSGAQTEKEVSASKKWLSVKEAEALGYYDFMSYLGVPYYHTGGLTSTKKLAELCRIDRTKKVLMIGCGTGFSACFLARKIGCNVMGIDIAELSLEEAKERARRQGVSDRVEFRVADAYALPFEAGTFDAVITEFVSQFLDRGRTFKEFARVLKQGGYVGINEMYKEERIPPKAAEEIAHAEKVFGKITGLPFSLPTPEEWKRGLQEGGLKDVNIRKFRPSPGPGEVKALIEGMGGSWKFARYFAELILKMGKYYLFSRKIRSRFNRLGEGKKTLLRKKSTSQYVGYVLATGIKE